MRRWFLIEQALAGKVTVRKARERLGLRWRGWRGLGGFNPHSSPQISAGTPRSTRELPASLHDAEGNGEPFAQIDLSTEIPATNEDGTINDREDGY